MPRQVWQSEDGRTFDTEQECAQWERAQALEALWKEKPGDPAALGCWLFKNWDAVHALVTGEVESVPPPESGLPLGDSPDASTADRAGASERVIPETLARKMGTPAFLREQAT